MQNKKKIIFSGVAPSGNIHIGNYFGAIKQWVELQNAGEYQNIFASWTSTPSPLRKTPRNSAQKFWKFSFSLFGAWHKSGKINNFYAIKCPGTQRAQLDFNPL